MYEIYSTNWQPTAHADPRDRYHETALLEARMTTDYRLGAHQSRDRGGLLARFRALLPGAAAAQEPCACPA